jgi:hypothetical protein
LQMNNVGVVALGMVVFADAVVEELFVAMVR